MGLNPPAKRKLSVYLETEGVTTRALAAKIKADSGGEVVTSSAQISRFARSENPQYFIEYDIRSGEIYRVWGEKIHEVYRKSNEHRDDTIGLGTSAAN